MAVRDFEIRPDFRRWHWRWELFFAASAISWAVEIEGTFEVTEYEPNKRYGFKSLSGPLHSQTLYTFELAGGATKVNISTQASATNVFQSDEGVLEKKMKKQLKENLELAQGYSGTK